ncbi:MAG TPA: nicotinate-nucleotide adenylyltransferase [Phycisphaerae bacterium]|nr:nicotinate-nucleotide adenylyltransferase [Phycisphaerae bacterium]
MRIGLYGGSFDPIHFGHLISARSVAEQLSLEKIVLIPCGQPPHKRDRVLTDARHRLELLRLAVEGDPLFEVDDREVRQPGPSYTIQSVDAYREQFGDVAELFWIIGADSLPELPTWHRVGELVERVQIVTAVRPGFAAPPADLLKKAVGSESAEQLLKHCLHTPEIDISASDLRRRIHSGRSIRYLVPESARSYIDLHNLYRA